MQIEALKIYCDVVRYNSFSRAAEENGITQSTASQTVHKLEDHLKEVLIDRSHRPWKPTAAGDICFQRSKEVLQAYHRLENDVSRLHPEQDAEIRVGTIYSVGLAYMNDYTDAFSQHWPSTKLTVEYLHPEQICSMVRNGELDLGIMAFPDSQRDLANIPWCEEEMVLVCNPDHPLAARRDLKTADLANESLICFDRDLLIGREIVRTLKDHGVDANIAIRFDNVESIKRAAEISPHLAIIPRTTITREVETGTLIQVPLADLQFSRPLGIVYRRESSFSPAMDHFVDLLTTTRVHPDQFLNTNKTETKG